MQGNWENWRNSFWWSANREFFLSENDFKRSSEIQKFSRENVDIFWWSANRDKFCKVVRESEKVENRCYILLVKDLPKVPGVTARMGLEPTTFRSKGIESTNVPPRPTNINR